MSSPLRFALLDREGNKERINGINGIKYKEEEKFDPGSSPSFELVDIGVVIQSIARLKIYRRL